MAMYRSRWLCLRCGVEKRKEKEGGGKRYVKVLVGEVEGVIEGV
jgi:hypothetical protein